MCRPIPEFLCYKYKGVRRVDQILASATPFAWKCRKYQNWKEVQNAPDDKQHLLKFADALLAGGKLLASEYGRISGIFYNVQRWRKDKQQLAEEPDPLPAWSTLDSLLRVVAENPKVAAQKLEREIPAFKDISTLLLWEFFYGWALHQLLTAEKVPALPETACSAPVDKTKLDKQLVALIQFLYKSASLTPPDLSDSRALIAKAYTDLGFPTPSFDYAFTSEDLATPQTAKTLVVRYANLGPLELMKAKEIDGHVDLCINSEHVFVKNALADKNTNSVLEALLTAHAEAAQQLPSHAETLETFTSYLGIILRRKANKTLK